MNLRILDPGKNSVQEYEVGERGHRLWNELYDGGFQNMADGYCTWDWLTSEQSQKHSPVVVGQAIGPVKSKAYFFSVQGIDPPEIDLIGRPGGLESFTVTGSCQTKIDGRSVAGNLKQVITVMRGDTYSDLLYRIDPDNNGWEIDKESLSTPTQADDTSMDILIKMSERAQTDVEAGT